ncbi:MAG: hypothetical protein IJG57_04090, partial [Firmicutes bacterium]|nr:hypothetical protein [Bacillota bacterium]
IPKISIAALPVQVLIYNHHLKLKTVFRHNKTDLLKLDSWSNFWGSVQRRVFLNAQDLDFLFLSLYNKVLALNIMGDDHELLQRI